MKEYQVFVARQTDITAPFIWLTDPGVPSRTVARITNPDNGKKVYCEILVVDDNFRRSYNDAANTKTISQNIDAAIVNAWYRKCLGIEKNRKAKLSVSVPFYTPQIIGQIRAALSHPDNAVRLASDIAVVSAMLGAIGLALGVISLCG